MEDSEEVDTWWRMAMDYLKTLSPSGVELEMINLSSYDFSDELRDDPDFYVSKSNYSHSL